MSGQRKRRWAWTRRFRNRIEAQIDCQRQSKGWGAAELKEDRFSDIHEIGGEGLARRSENGAKPWGEVEAKFQAHGAEAAVGAE